MHYYKYMKDGVVAQYEATERYIKTTKRKLVVYDGVATIITVPIGNVLEISKEEYDEFMATLPPIEQEEI